LGCDREQVVVEAEEVGQRPLCRGEHAQPGWHGWLEVVVGVAVESVLVPLPATIGGQPGEIERPEIAGGKLGTNSDDRRQQRLGVIVKVTGLVLAGEIEHNELLRDPGTHLIADAVTLDDIGVEQITWQAEHHSGVPQLATYRCAS
jgi:hypothetical protein